mgnify:CR=1 FL=1
MDVTLDLTPEMEARLRDGLTRNDAEAVRRVLHDAVDTTAETLLRQQTVGIWQDYDPAKVREALRTTAGSWADIDVDRLIEDINRAREAGSRPSERP